MVKSLNKDERKALQSIHALGFDFYLLWLRKRHTARGGILQTLYLNWSKNKSRHQICPRLQLHFKPKEDRLGTIQISWHGMNGQ